MEIRVRSTGAVMFEEEFRRYVTETYQASYNELTIDLINQFDADPVLESPTPVVARYEKFYRDGVQEIEGKWYIKYTVITDVTPEEKKAMDDQQGLDIRAVRNTLLAETDWTQMPDNNLANKANWGIYRQELRDLTKQIGFPWDVKWPEKPE